MHILGAFFALSKKHHLFIRISFSFGENCTSLGIWDEKIGKVWDEEHDCAWMGWYHSK
jgi:hypothetical protein